MSTAPTGPEPMTTPDRPTPSLVRKRMACAVTAASPQRGRAARAGAAAVADVASLRGAGCELPPHPASASTIAASRPNRRLVGGPVREVLLVDADLARDDPQALLELGELALDALLLLAQQLEALLLVPRALAHELGQAADLRQRHARRPQLDADPQPVDVVRAVAAAAARAARDVLGDHQALALVEPQRVDPQPGLARDVADAQLLFDNGHELDDST